MYSTRNARSRRPVADETGGPSSTGAVKRSPDGRGARSGKSRGRADDASATIPDEVGSAPSPPVTRHRQQQQQQQQQQPPAQNQRGAVRRRNQGVSAATATKRSAAQRRSPRRDGDADVSGANQKSGDARTSTSGQNSSLASQRNQQQQHRHHQSDSNAVGHRDSLSTSSFDGGGTGADSLRSPGARRPTRRAAMRSKLKIQLDDSAKNSEADDWDDVGPNQPKKSPQSGRAAAARAAVKNSAGASSAVAGDKLSSVDRDVTVVGTGNHGTADMDTSAKNQGALGSETAGDEAAADAARHTTNKGAGASRPGPSTSLADDAPSGSVLANRKIAKGDPDDPASKKETEDAKQGAAAAAAAAEDSDEDVVLKDSEGAQRRLRDAELMALLDTQVRSRVERLVEAGYEVPTVPLDGVNSKQLLMRAAEEVSMPASRSQFGRTSQEALMGVNLFSKEHQVRLRRIQRIVARQRAQHVLTTGLARGVAIPEQISGVLLDANNQTQNHQQQHQQQNHHQQQQLHGHLSSVRRQTGSKTRSSGTRAPSNDAPPLLVPDISDEGSYDDDDLLSSGEQEPLTVATRCSDSADTGAAATVRAPRQRRRGTTETGDVKEEGEGEMVAGSSSLSGSDGTSDDDDDDDDDSVLPQSVLQSLSDDHQDQAIGSVSSFSESLDYVTALSVLSAVSATATGRKPKANVPGDPISQVLETAIAAPLTNPAMRRLLDQASAGGARDQRRRGGARQPLPETGGSSRGGDQTATVDSSRRRSRRRAAATAAAAAGGAVASSSDPRSPAAKRRKAADTTQQQQQQQQSGRPGSDGSQPQEEKATTDGRPEQLPAVPLTFDVPPRSIWTPQFSLPVNPGDAEEARAHLPSSTASRPLSPEPEFGVQVAGVNYGVDWDVDHSDGNGSNGYNEGFTAGSGGQCALCAEDDDVSISSSCSGEGPDGRDHGGHRRRGSCRHSFAQRSGLAVARRLQRRRLLLETDAAARVTLPHALAMKVSSSGAFRAAARAVKQMRESVRTDLNFSEDDDVDDRLLEMSVASAQIRRRLLRQQRMLNRRSNNVAGSSGARGGSKPADRDEASIQMDKSGGVAKGDTTDIDEIDGAPSTEVAAGSGSNARKRKAAEMLIDGTATTASMKPRRSRSWSRKAALVTSEGSAAAAHGDAADQSLSGPLSEYRERSRREYEALHQPVAEGQDGHRKPEELFPDCDYRDEANSVIFRVFADDDNVARLAHQPRELHIKLRTYLWRVWRYYFSRGRPAEAARAVQLAAEKARRSNPILDLKVRRRADGSSDDDEAENWSESGSDTEGRWLLDLTGTVPRRPLPAISTSLVIPAEFKLPPPVSIMVNDREVAHFAVAPHENALKVLGPALDRLVRDDPIIRLWRFVAVRAPDGTVIQPDSQLSVYPCYAKKKRRVVHVCQLMDFIPNTAESVWVKYAMHWRLRDRSRKRESSEKLPEQE